MAFQPLPDLSSGIQEDQQESVAIVKLMCLLKQVSSAQCVVRKLLLILDSPRTAAEWCVTPMVPAQVAALDKANGMLEVG